MDRTFLQARIDKIKLQIVAYEDAIDAILLGGVKSYTLNTGQTTQTVTKLDLKSLQTTLDGLMNRLAVYESRLNGTGVLIAGPSF